MFFFHIFAAFEEPFIHTHYSLFLYKGAPVERIIAPLGQMCVTIFAFNTGYVMQKMPSMYSPYIKVMKRLAKFLISYWVVCAIFLIYGIAFHLQLPTFTIFLKNMFGFEVSVTQPYINVAHAWYVKYYIFILLISPLIIKLFTRSKWYVDLSMLIMLMFLLPKWSAPILSIIWPITSTLTGMFAYKYKLLEVLQLAFTIKNKLYFRIFVDLFIIFMVFACRHEFSGYNPWWRLDGLFVLLFIAAFTDLFNYISPKVLNVLRFIGSIGMYMWYLHSLYMVDINNWENILYYPAYPFLILTLGILMMIPPAIFCKKVSDKISSKILD